MRINKVFGLFEIQSYIVYSGLLWPVLVATSVVFIAFGYIKFGFGLLLMYLVPALIFHFTIRKGNDNLEDRSLLAKFYALSVIFHLVYFVLVYASNYSARWTQIAFLLVLLPF